MQKQVDAMRRLYRQYKGDREACVQAYADLERTGKVGRKSKRIGIDEYASRLYSNGQYKGWIKEDPSDE